ncbi:Fascin-like domain-containing protein [Pandoravirus kuranda]|uniref:Fascin-like domain-containing protein n=1 Tax=Pandoravirus kuranda TaxID=3019033 RepID=A0AA95EN31_9VIRU|nr:Fascin-like domain-containing protein [Pandoravirus kuranda]
MGSHIFCHSAATMAVVALFLLAYCIGSGHAYRETVFVGASGNWTAPPSAVDVTVTLWGGGGGGAAGGSCGASGGSGAAIINRTTSDSTWGIPLGQVQWSIVVGHGGAPLHDARVGGTADSGGATTVVATAPNGTELFRATAYGGGGGTASHPSPYNCYGGAGGGANSSATGSIPGSGTPSGGTDYDPLGPPQEGAMVGDIKAGGAGSGHGFIGGNTSNPILRGASWTSPGRHWDGDGGRTKIDSFFGLMHSYGGAAGFNGNGGPPNADIGGAVREPPANSGSGGASAVVVPKFYSWLYSHSPGAAGGAIIEYTQLIPSTVAFQSSVSGKYLTAHSYSGVSANATVAQAWERWTAIRLANGKYAFRSWQGKYLKANPTYSAEATATVVNDWEQFDAIYLGSLRWTLKTHHDTYLAAAADGFVYCSNDATHYWTAKLM